MKYKWKNDSNFDDTVVLEWGKHSAIEIVKWVNGRKYGFDYTITHYPDKPKPSIYLSSHTYKSLAICKRAAINTAKKLGLISVRCANEVH
jgi:hypothetical protein